MQLALLGVDETVWQLVAAAVRRGDDAVVCAYEAGEFQEQLKSIGTDIRPGADWEELIHAPKCDAIVVGRGGDAELLPEQLRRLIQSDTPLAVAHPIADMLLGFELQMIRHDTSTIVMPFFTGCDHPIWKTIRAWVDAPDRSPIGRVEQFEWERALAIRDRSSVERAFARDSFLQRTMMGPIERLGAMLSGHQSAHETDDWSHLSAHMDNDRGLLARWSVKPVSAGLSRLQIIGENGSATAELGADPQAWTLTVTSPTQQAVDFEPWNGPDAVLNVLRQAVAGDCSPANQMFEHACRAAELVDSLETSCRRGRTIDLHLEELTEEGTFKSVMAAGGCLALTATLLLTLLVVVVSPFSRGARADQTPVPPADAHWVWKLLLAGLLVFLGLQFLRLLFPQRSANRGRNPDAPHSS